MFNSPVRAATYLVDILALELLKELGQTLLVSIDANGGQDALDVVGGGAAVASEAKEEVSREVLHFAGVLFAVSIAPTLPVSQTYC